MSRPVSLTRRDLLEVGAVSLLGLTAADLMRAREAPTNNTRARSFGRARSCVVIFLWGGPGQQDLWDLKPDAPAEIRGEFRPVATTVPGTQISDQLPQLARQMDKVTLVRSVTHRDSEHGSAAYTALTGHPHPLPGTNTPTRADDFPTYGSVVTKLRPANRAIPTAVILGPVMHQGPRPPVAGQNAGFLGRSYDPFRVAEDPSGADFQVEALQPAVGVTAERLEDRRALLEVLDRQARQLEALAGHGLTAHQQRAFELLQSPQTRRAFDLSAEPAALRERYGRSRFGQALVLARRLVEAGVPFITVNWEKQNGDQWDTHKRNFGRLRELLPVFDRGLAAFLADLHDRGLLETTLVYCLGEFGRSPRINADAGRDHWPHCYSVLLAGGGVPAGAVVGASDRFAAYPSANPMTPGDLSATLFYSLGIDPQTHLTDPQGRPLPVSPGRVVAELLE
ncbi:MAG: DUF1501 domain-containing protein [Gemmataceae bacterium]|nr:DUF1501 domain-containing protein [Gemmataceae bacterium]MDW8265422.1 DUF1501 domain-containing protein [Gemmataceae bacterium]